MTTRVRVYDHPKMPDSIKNRIGTARIYKRLPLDVRFLRKVDFNGPIPSHKPELGPCHVWTGRKYGGYGRFRITDYGEVLAHRFAFFLAEGRWPDPNGLHHCDNPPCVRRSHIFEGTKAENNADRARKGRSNSARGEQQWRAKLTDDRVRFILARPLAKSADLAKAFGVTQDTISLVRRGKIWKHIERSMKISPEVACDMIKAIQQRKSLLYKLTRPDLNQ